MFDKKGRVWFAAAVRGAEQSGLLQEGLGPSFGQALPGGRTHRHLSMLDPKTQQYTFVDTCFGTHHLQFGYDANDMLWTSGGGPVIGWLNMKMFDETGDAAKSQGWTALILDTNGNGKRDDYVEPDQPVDPTKDKRIVARLLRRDAEPRRRLDLGLVSRPFPGAVVRLAPGSNPPETALAEIYNVPKPGFGIRGADIDKQGRRVGVARERPSRQLRSAQVQRPAQRPEGHRRSLPRGLVVLSVSRSRISRASARTARSRATTPGSISTTRSASARTCRCPPAT